MGRVGNFEVRGELERGPGFTIYQGLHTGLGEPVVLKVLHYGAAVDPQLRQRFVSEGSRLTCLKHPCIQEVVEVGEAGGQPFVAMKPVSAQRIGALLQRRADALPPLTAAQIACRLAAALEHCHAEGIVHRDVSMNSILLTPDGRPVLTDFGVTKDIDPSAAGVAQTGRCMGTPGYSSPEQASGQMSRIGPSVDVYGLGAVLYTLLVRQTPIQGNSPMGIMARTLSQVPAPPRSLRPEIPQDLEAVCLRCLAKAPEQRYASVGDLRRALEEVVSAASATATERPRASSAPPATAERRGPSRAPASIEETADDPGSKTKGEAENHERSREDDRKRTGGPSRVVLGLAAAGLLVVIGVGGFFAAGGLSKAPAPTVEPGPAAEPSPVDAVDAADPGPPSSGDEALGFVEEGLEKLSALQLRGALAAFDEAIELDPSQALAYHGRGNVRFAEGNYEAALADYAKAIALAPDAAEPHHNRGAAAESLGRTADAIASYERFLELAPEHPQAPGVRVDLARLREELGD